MEMERERDKRVQNLAQVGLRRILAQGLAKGWSAWYDMWSQKTHQSRLLAASAGRLAKPKLAAAVTHWVHDWRTEAAHLSQMSISERMKDLTMKTVALFKDPADMLVRMVMSKEDARIRWTEATVLIIDEVRMSENCNFAIDIFKKDKFS